MIKFIAKITLLTLSTFIFCLNANAVQSKNMIVTVKMMVKKGEMVNKSNLKLIPYNRKNIPADLITKIDDAANLQTLRHLRTGLPLRYSYLREKPEVSKDKIVKAIYNKPGLVLESTVQALQDGVKGDIIKVKNIKTNKILTATVTEENTVSVN